MAHNCGIYEIVSKKSVKTYIGQSANLKRRKRDHFQKLRDGTHGNIHIQRSYSKNGSEFFDFNILLYCEPSELSYYEQKIIDSRPKELLYNICLESCQTTLGIKRGTPSIETLKKISTSLAGRKFSKLHREKLSVLNSGKNNAMYGMTGEKHPLYGKTGEQSPFFGKKHSEETKKKISKALSGERNPMHGRTGENSPNFGNVLSEETRKKISESKTGGQGTPCSQENRDYLSKKHLGSGNPMFGKGGEKSPAAKLTKDQAFEILHLYHVKKISSLEISKRFGVHCVTIERLAKGLSWKKEFSSFMEKHLRVDIEV
jgi:group I intron endonuclease